MGPERYWTSSPCHVKFRKAPLGQYQKKIGPIKVRAPQELQTGKSHPTLIFFVEIIIAKRVSLVRN